MLEGARETGDALVLSTAPDVCLTPMGPALVPVPYPIVAYFSMVTQQSETVTMTGCKVATKATKITVVFGDEPGTGGGVKSGVNKSIVEFTSWSATVTCGGEPVIRHMDDAKMNNGNTLGKVIYPSPGGGSSSWIDEDGEIQGDTNPTEALAPETEEESGFLDQFGKRFDEIKDDYKGMWNTAKDAVGLGDEKGDFGAAWGRIWDGTKAAGQLGLDVVTVAADYANPVGYLARSLGAPTLGEILNPGAGERLKQVGSAIVEEYKAGYQKAYAEGGLSGALGRGTMDALHLAAEALVGKGVGKLTRVGKVTSKLDEVAEVAGKMDEVEDVLDRTSDIQRLLDKPIEINDAIVVNKKGGVVPVNKGKEGIERAIREIEENGGEVIGREITVDANGVRTRPDLLVRTKEGELMFVEVKNGPTAGLTSNQKKAFPLIEAGGAVPRGKNARAAGLAELPQDPIPIKVIHYP
ncbi:MAG: DUF4150 domain-containing protein [Deltaproteobacteria bacterium]|nr:DUF4150 domain-containing protein [Deltaproteobacteria bacterium]